MLTTLRDRLSVVREKIEKAALRAGRDPASVTLVIASKTQPASVMQDLIDLYALEGKKPVFGESYVQEYRKKQALLRGEYSCHLIGALQRNKAGHALRIFDAIEAVHSVEIAQALNVVAEQAGITIDVYLQVNISNDFGKFGFRESEVQQFIFYQMPVLSNLRLNGLMTITRLYHNSADVRGDFVKMLQLRDAILEKDISRGKHLVGQLALSMGMSDDFEIAVEEGASLVRIGTALFGERNG